VYQPKIDLRSGAIIGVEALARWQHRSRGIVSAADFVPVSEDAGLASALARVVTANALRDARHWGAAAPALHVAVNVAMANAAKLDLPDRVEALARAAGFPLERLVLELSTRRLPAGAGARLDIMSRLRLKGVRLSIGGFGCTLSSLAELRDLPFSELRLDPECVRGVAGDPSRRAIVHAALALSREVDALVVAEGVAEREDLDCLRELGCPPSPCRPPRWRPGSAAGRGPATSSRPPERRRRQQKTPGRPGVFRSTLGGR